MGKFIEKFGKTEYSFRERVGAPDALSSGIGRVIINFQLLDEEINHSIHWILRSRKSACDIITAGLSFRNKVDLLFCLIEEYKDKILFNTPHVPMGHKIYIKELRNAITKCEELRNSIVHSSYLGIYWTYEKAMRVKKSIKTLEGLRVIKESISGDNLLDIADYIIYISMELEEMIKLSKRRKTYLKNNQFKLFK